MKEFIIGSLITGVLWACIVGPLLYLTLEQVLFGWGLSILLAYVVKWVTGIWLMTRK